MVSSIVQTCKCKHRERIILHGVLWKADAVLLEYIIVITHNERGNHSSKHGIPKHNGVIQGSCLSPLVVQQ